jgi:hypothetical protein
MKTMRCRYGSPFVVRLSQQGVVGFLSKTDESLCCQLRLGVHHG